eukprot:2248631-Prymnesium_polylepis.1
MLEEWAVGVTVPYRVCVTRLTWGRCRVSAVSGPFSNLNASRAGSRDNRHRIVGRQTCRSPGWVRSEEK